MQRKLALLSLSVITFLFAIPTLNAETLSITPGKWRMETVTSSSMAPQPQTETEMAGTMKYTISGTNMTGKYSAKMGQFSMQGTSSGERIGDCD